MILYYDGVHEVDKINISPLNLPFTRNLEIGPSMSQNYATLDLRISSRDFLKFSRMMGLNK